MHRELVGPIGDLVRRQAAAHGARQLFVEEGRVLTYAEYDARTEAAARGLVSVGLRPGDRVATYMGNSVALLEAYTAIAKAGAVTVFCNAQLTAREVAYLVTDSEARMVVTDAAHSATVQGVLAQCPSVDRVIAVDEWPRGPASARLPDVRPHDQAWIGYTSGTTGLPKGAGLTHHGVTWAAAAMVDALGQTEADVILCALPMFHSYAVNSCYLQPIMAGASQVVLPRFTVAAVLEAIERHRVSLYPAVPTMLTFLAHAPERAHARVDSLRLVQSAGAVLKAQVYRDFEAAFGAPIHDGWGSTETSSFATVTPVNATRVPGSCGLPLPGCAVRIVDPEGGDLAPGERGEMLVRGPNVTGGYLNKPEQTAAALAGGWYHTGDVATFDDHGYVYVVDRLKDLIISGGYNIAPKEIEDVILAHPAVLDVAVVGIADAARGEVPKAFVVCKDDAPLEAETLLAHCRRELAAYKLPRAVAFVTELPKTASGKVQRFRLRGGA
jgi:rifamycin polyketide synthase module 1/2/3